MLGQADRIGMMRQLTHGRQTHEALTQTLHASPLLIHGQDQLGPHGADGRSQLAYLAWMLDVAREDDQSGDFGLAQQMSVLGGKPSAGDVDHQGALQTSAHEVSL